jgi:Zn-dependent metalloprotease
MFHLLANGGTSRCNGQAVTGIGRDEAARTACLNAATALYGTGSPEHDTVVAAYAAINVH